MTIGVLLSDIRFLIRVIFLSNSPLLSHLVRKNCSSIGTVQE